jgi:hypothetical protein
LGKPGKRHLTPKVRIGISLDDLAGSRRGDGLDLDHEIRGRRRVSFSASSLGIVVPGLVPGIHVFASKKKRKTWMAGSSPAMTGWRAHAQFRGADIGGGPRPIAFFGFSVPM